MNLFKSIIKWTGVCVWACFLATIAYAATLPEPVKVYLIISNRTGDYTIEKIFLIKENAVKYKEQYKESHNYEIEQRKLSE